MKLSVSRNHERDCPPELCRAKEECHIDPDILWTAAYGWTREICKLDATVVTPAMIRVYMNNIGVCSMYTPDSRLRDFWKSREKIFTHVLMDWIRHRMRIIISLFDDELLTNMFPFHIPPVLIEGLKDLNQLMLYKGNNPRAVELKLSTLLVQFRAELVNNRDENGHTDWRTKRTNKAQLGLHQLKRITTGMREVVCSGSLGFKVACDALSLYLLVLSNANIYFCESKDPLEVSDKHMPRDFQALTFWAEMDPSACIGMVCGVNYDGPLNERGRPAEVGSLGEDGTPALRILRQQQVMDNAVNQKLNNQ